jgi:serine/threonine protein kinase
MSICTSLVCIEGQFGTAHWYQNPLNVTNDDLCQQKSTLGEGAFSIVEHVIYQGRHWALKRPLHQAGHDFIRREADLLVSLNRAEKRVDREYCVQLVAFINLGFIPMALLPLYKGGDLFSRIENSEKGLSLESTLKITEQMLKALSFLKEQEIIHRDIKPENIFMVGSDDTIRLGDFGLAMKKGDIEQNRESVGTPDYVSPELLESLIRKSDTIPYDFPSDMWATGCLLFFAFSRIRLVTFSRGDPQCAVNLESQQKDGVRRFDANMTTISVNKGLDPSNALTFFQSTLKFMLDLDPTQKLAPEEGKTRFSENRSPVSISASEELA